MRCAAVQETGSASSRLQTTMAAELECMNGLCMMLGHHLDALEAAQQPLKSAVTLSTDSGQPEGKLHHNDANLQQHHLGCQYQSITDKRLFCKKCD